ncbi:hypothetical protein FB45DRAFT_885699 [Roridomyces roridus]|uniref:F-box domain-containing protein n=1 Tax=Roridomyces roridus TaxID=1738132 RepID=A0AAD7FXZ7_9AGAR|nr:hypothetical protein FB45DRAFT_885699 [Roridomyces roridus]
MDSGLSCDSSCSVHCVPTSPLSSPFPELYSNGVPSDSQHAIIFDSIQRAKADLARIEAEMATLKAQRAELNRFICYHTGMISAVRRFPNETLADIFSRCVDPDAEFDPLRNGVWILGRVCQRWRAVALGTPELWRHFILRETGEQDPLKPFLKIQLDRARSAPLSIRFSARRSIELMDVFLDVPAQWEDVHVNSSDPRMGACFMRWPDSHFPRLRRLEITSYHPMLEGRTSRVNLVDSLPALEYLWLDIGFKPFPGQLLLPWSQLRTCILRQFSASDVLRVLPLVSRETHVSIIDPWIIPAILTAADSPIRSVQIIGRGTNVSVPTERLLIAMILPNLEKLEIGWTLGPEPLEGAISLLNTSACHLKHLSLPQGPYPLTQLISLLESPHVRDIVRLDIPHISNSEYTPSLLAKLEGNGAFLPHLHTLAIRGDSRDIEALNVLDILRDRRPTTRKVSFTRWGWDFPERERGSRDTGLEVVVLHG